MSQCQTWAEKYPELLIINANIGGFHLVGYLTKFTQWIIYNRQSQVDDDN